METVATPENLEAFFRLALQAASAGKWPQLIALALVGLVFLLRKLVAPKVPFFATGEGGAVLTLLASFAGALATALFAPGVAFSGTLVLGALQAALVAAGGWSLVKHLLPLLLRLPFLAKFFPSRGEVAAPVPVLAPVPAPTSDQIVNGK